MRHTNLIESNENDAFHGIWDILWPILEGKISKLYFKAYCMTLVQKLLICIPSHSKRAKIGLRSPFYLNCSHLLLLDLSDTKVSLEVHVNCHRRIIHLFSKYQKIFKQFYAAVLVVQVS